MDKIFNMFGLSTSIARKLVCKRRIRYRYRLFILYLLRKTIHYKINPDLKLIVDQLIKNTLENKSIANLLDKVNANYFPYLNVLYDTISEYTNSFIILRQIKFIKPHIIGGKKIIQIIAEDLFPLEDYIVPKEILRHDKGIIQATARDILERRAFNEMPILGDMLEDAGASEFLANHARNHREHSEGCWLLDYIR